jgi:hypothetical protein
MSRFALLLLTALTASALGAQCREALFGYATEKSVREVCGENLKSNDGTFGCTVEQDGELRDYSCNDKPKMAGSGCRVFFRAAPKPRTGTSEGR